MEDDSKNKVNAENETVTLSEDLHQNILNGQIFAKLMAEMHRTFIMRTGNSFELVKQPLAGSREENWSLLVPQLRQFGIAITESKAQRLKKGDAKQLKSLLTTLFEIDTSPTPQRLQPNASQGKMGIKLESIKLDALDLDTVIDSQSTDGPRNKSTNQKLTGIGLKHKPTGSMSQVILEPIETQNQGSHISKESLEKNKSLADQPATSSNLDEVQYPQASVRGRKSSLSPEFNKSPFNEKNGPQKKKKQDIQNVRRSQKISSINKSDFKDLEMPELLDETLTSAQFILKSLIVAFEMNSKQAIGLLSDNHRYLYHTCIKGLKGSNFKNIIKWYDLMIPHASHLVSLLELESQNQAEAQKPPLSVNNRKGAGQQKSSPPVPVKTLMKTLNILKGGLYSKNEDVVLSCVNLFQIIVAELNLSGGEVIGQTWDWFVQPSQVSQQIKMDKDETAPKLTSLNQLNANRRVGMLRQPNQKGGHSVPSKSPIMAAGVKSIKGSVSPPESKKEIAEPNEFIEILQQSGLQAVINAFQSCESTKKGAAYLMLHFGKFNAVELFTEKLLTLLPQWSEYSLFCQELFLVTQQSEIASETLEMKGILSFWVLQSLKVAESSGEVTLDDRIASLVFLTEIWLTSTDYIDTTLKGSGGATLNILKRAARDVKQTLAIISIELMFRLLEQFARIKHSLAPTLYKTLTFILVEFYWEIEIRDLIVRHFIYLFKKLDSIPVAILCEPLLKQVQISQYHTTTFNVFDFEFFQVVAQHKKLNLQTSLLLMDALTKIALSSVFYSKVAIVTMRALIMRFSKQQEIFTHWKETFRQMLQSLISIETTLTQHRLAAKEEKNVFFDRLARNGKSRRTTKLVRGKQPAAELRLTNAETIAIKTNERLIVNVLEKLILLGNELLNEELRQQLIDAFMAIEHQLEVRSKPITYLLSKYGFNVDAMISHKISVSEEDNQASLIEKNRSPPARNLVISPKDAEGLANLDVLQKTRSRSASKSPQRISNEIAVKSEENQRKVETAHLNQNNAGDKAKPVFKSRLIKPTTIVSPKPAKVSASAQLRSTSHITSTQQVLQLYDYRHLESATNLLRYRHFVKRNLKLLKELFQRYEGNETKTSRVPNSQMTFENKKKMNQVISSQGLIKMIKELDIIPTAGSFVTAIRIRQDIPLLIKLINQLPDTHLETKLPELSFDGFVEFLLQYCHQLWNVSSLMNTLDKQLLAVELGEKLFEAIKRTNEEKRLMISLKHFVGNDYLAADNPEELGMLQLLNQKVAENPDYAIPQGYKKVQELIIEDSYQVPDLLKMKESEKVSLELLDEIFMKALGVHLLISVPVTRTVHKVTLDTKKAFVDYAVSRNIRSQSQGSIDAESVGLHKKKLQANVSQNSSLRVDTQSVKNSPRFKGQYVSSPQVYAAKAKNLDHSFKGLSLSGGAPKIRPVLKLAVMQAESSEKERVGECASILEEILLAVEHDKTAGFSLMEIDENRSYLDSMLGPGLTKKQRRGTYKRSATGSQDTNNIPRYLQQNFVSKRTLKRQKEMEEEKAAREKPIPPEEKRERDARVKESLKRHEAYLENQRKLQEEQKLNQQKELEKNEQARARAQKHRQAKTEALKLQINDFNEKKEKEKQEQKAKEEEEKKQKNAEANMLLKKKNAEIAEGLKKLHQDVIKQKEERQQSLEKLIALPKRPKINYAVKPKEDVPMAEEENKIEEGKSKKPSVIKQERSVRSVSRKGVETSQKSTEDSLKEQKKANKITKKQKPAIPKQAQSSRSTSRKQVEASQKPVEDLFEQRDQIEQAKKKKPSIPKQERPLRSINQKGVEAQKILFEDQKPPKTTSTVKPKGVNQKIDKTDAMQTATNPNTAAGNDGPIESENAVNALLVQPVETEQSQDIKINKKNVLLNGTQQSSVGPLTSESQEFE